jgi:hypothetical protein
VDNDGRGVVAVDTFSNELLTGSVVGAEFPWVLPLAEN